MSDETAALSVLVVEDEPLIRENTAEILEDAGYEVLQADNAATALALMAERPEIRVLFTDVNMPGAMDGLDLVHEVHARWPSIMLLVTSGRQRIPTGDIPDDGQFLGKPYGGAQLVERVRALFATHRDGG